MLRNAKELIGSSLQASDGKIGTVQDLYFDDESWTIRYMVVDTSRWLPGRQVILAPHAVRHFDPTNRRIEVAFNRQKIEQAPPLDEHQPISRRYEIDYYKYYGWPVYWSGPALWGPGPYPMAYSGSPVEPYETEHIEAHLRSVQEVLGYAIEARDGEIGHADDFFLEEENWALRYVLVDTKNWLPGKKVLVATHWIERVQWDRSLLHVDLARGTIENAPPFQSHVHTPISREYEEKLFEYYKREAYWQNPEHAGQYR